MNLLLMRPQANNKLFTRFRTLNPDSVKFIIMKKEIFLVQAKNQDQFLKLTTSDTFLIFLLF